MRVVTFNVEDYTRVLFPSGRVMSEGNIIEGKRDGVWRFWHERGGLKEVGHYLMGEKVGRWRYWDENGEFLFKIEYT